MACGVLTKEHSAVSSHTRVHASHSTWVHAPLANDRHGNIASRAWLRGAVERRIREELAKSQVEVNEEKTRVVDLARGESFGFLEFEFRRVRSRAGKRMPLRTPQGKKRTALLRKLEECFRRARPQPTGELIATINPILRGWVIYFATGHSGRCFAFIRTWVEMKLRRHLAKARLRQGFGWQRWSRKWLYEGLGLFDDHRVRRYRSSPKAAPAG